MDDFYVQFEAISPTTGAAVSGVTVANAAIFVEDDGPAADAGTSGPFMWVPGPNTA